MEDHWKCELCGKTDKRRSIHSKPPRCLKCIDIEENDDQSPIVQELLEGIKTTVRLKPLEEMCRDYSRRLSYL
jgi:hypothetical protein